ncbi:MAG TPA: hypothetical protein DCQ93_00105 [Bacteroidetes bacterium]|nr:hypothetical protein [Bacteroidota bacterium]
MAFSQTPMVYFNFVSHNEETSQWDAPFYYSANRNKLISLANYFQSNGITWNMQSDWRYLNNVIMKDTSYFFSTGNKNILRWMHEDKGVEMDPHAHESIYIYPDVVHLMDSLELPESEVIGGTIYNDSNGVNIWTNLSNGQYGIIYPQQFWKPSYMMGGGTPNHTNDLEYYGIWNPQSPSAFLTHDTLQPLRQLGVGCTIKIFDTSTVSDVVNQLKDLIQHVQTGEYPNNGFYLQTIFFEQGDLNDQTFYNKVIEVADSANAIVASGAAQWKTFSQAYGIWETSFTLPMFQWECGNIQSGINDETETEISIYPNPVIEKLFVSSYSSLVNEIEIKDIFGRTVLPPITIKHSPFALDVHPLSPGIYFVQVTYQTGKISIQKIAVE